MEVGASEHLVHHVAATLNFPPFSATLFSARLLVKHYNELPWTLFSFDNHQHFIILISSNPTLPYSAPFCFFKNFKASPWHFVISFIRIPI